MRQIKGVDSNKLQPIIRYHNDKDFRVQFVDIQSVNYQKIINRPTKKEYSMESEGESDNQSIEEIQENNL